MPFFILLALVAAETAVFIQVGSRIGVGLTLLLVFISSVLGIWLVRVQGFAAAARVQGMILRGESPAAGLLEGLGLLIAGVLLLIPGFLTDIVALVLLVPPWRRRMVRFSLRRFRLTRLSGAPRPGAKTAAPPPLEGEARRED